MAQRHSRSGECNRCWDREKKSFAWASAGDLTWSLWLRVDTQVRTCRCVFAHAGFECKFHPETLVVILLAVGPYEIASGKYLRYSMLIASLMAASQRSIVAGVRGLVLKWLLMCQADRTKEKHGEMGIYEASHPITHCNISLTQMFSAHASHD